MVTLQEIQTLKTKLSGVRDKTVQAKTLYDSTMTRLIESLNKLVDLLVESDPINQPNQFFNIFADKVFSVSTDTNENGDNSCKIVSILDVDALSEVTNYVNSILSQMESDIEEKYKDISEQVEEWQKIIRGEQNAAT